MSNYKRIIDDSYDRKVGKAKDIQWYNYWRLGYLKMKCFSYACGKISQNPG